MVLQELARKARERPARVVASAAILASLLLTACSDATPRPQTQQSITSLPGTIYVLAGPDEVTQDIYRIHAGGDIKRLTTSRHGLGVSGITAANGKVVIAAGETGFDQIGTLTATGQFQPLPYKLPLRASTPQLSPDGMRLAYQEAREVSRTPAKPGSPEVINFHFILHVLDLQTGTDREIFESADPTGNFGWASNDSLAQLQTPGHDAQVLLIRLDGTKTPIATSTPTATGFRVSGANGRMALVMDGGVVVVADASGQHLASLRGWAPLGFSPDGSQLLVESTVGVPTPRPNAFEVAGDKLALATGANLSHIVDLGRSPVGPVYGVVWVQ